MKRTDNYLPKWYRDLQRNDPFGRLRVSNPESLFYSKMTYYISDDYDQLAVNGASITHAPALSGAVLAVDAQSNSKAILQSAEYVQYQPGNGHEVKITYGNIALQGGCVFMSGYFDDDNGVIVRYTATNVSVVLRTSISGSPVDIEVSQADWNIDRMDGTGPSNRVLDINARQIFAPDIEWLSTGTLLTGFFIDREFIPVHSFNHANTDGAAYMTSADLPLRWELVGDGSNTSSVVAECATAQTSGSRELKGTPFSLDTGNVSVGTTETWLIAVRPKIAFKGKLNKVKIDLVGLLGSTESATTQLRMTKNPTVTAASMTWLSVDDNSALEYATVPVGYTPGSGRRMFGIPVPANQQAGGAPGSGHTSLSAKEAITVHIDGSQDIILVSGEVIEGALASLTSATLNWRELQ